MSEIFGFWCKFSPVVWFHTTSTVDPHIRHTEEYRLPYYWLYRKLLDQLLVGNRSPWCLLTCSVLHYTTAVLPHLRDKELQMRDKFLIWNKFWEIPSFFTRDKACNEARSPDAPEVSGCDSIDYNIAPPPQEGDTQKYWPNRPNTDQYLPILPTNTALYAQTLL